MARTVVLVSGEQHFFDYLDMLFAALNDPSVIELRQVEGGRLRRIRRRGADGRWVVEKVDQPMQSDREGLEGWIESEIAFWRDLVTHDDGTLARFRELALRTVPVRPDAVFLPKAHAASAFSDPDLWGLTGDALTAWSDYAERWDRFVRSNPRIRLAVSLKAISESYDAASWPWGYEDQIAAWLHAGCPEPRPSFARGLNDAEIVELCDAAAADGWPVYEDPSGQGRGRLTWRKRS